jgi:Domain of unknown function (DUF2357)
MAEAKCSHARNVPYQDRRETAVTPEPRSGPNLSLESCYRDLGSDGSTRAAAEALLSRRDWLYSCAEFDQRTGEMLPSPLGRICERIGVSTADLATNGFKDRLYRIAAHIKEPLRDILHQMHERLVRRHSSLHIGAVRELDTTSFLALARRPGRTIREKLADRPHLLAVERYWTEDGAENRLVKALCHRLAHLIRTRHDIESRVDASWLQDFFYLIEQWLQSPAAVEIGRWENLPPNNILLQHRNYRRLWDAWLWSETLDTDLQRDAHEALAQWTMIVFWSVVSRFDAADSVRLLEQPCIADYERFSIVPVRSSTAEVLVVDGVIGAHVVGGRISDIWRAPVGFRISLKPGVEANIELPKKPWIQVSFRQDGSQVRVQVGQNVQVVEPSAKAAAALADAMVVAAFAALPQQIRVRPAPFKVADKPQSSPFGVIDFCRLRPHVFHGNRIGPVPFRLLWQLWSNNENETIELDVGEAQAISLGPNTITMSIFDLLTADIEISPDALSRAARGFVGKIADAIPTETLMYIVPDATDEFALGTLRRSINSTFRNAEPLPRSIATVFAWQSSPRFPASKVSDGDCVIVLDAAGSSLSATFLLARENAELEQRVPESAGIYWERTPTQLIDSGFAIVEMAAKILERCACPFSLELARLLGLDGVVDDTSDLSWHGHDGWFTLPNRLYESVVNAVGNGAPKWPTLTRVFEPEFRRLNSGARIHVLFADNIARMVPLEAPARHGTHDVCVINAHSEPVLGGATLHQWQARAGDIALWRDQLPELSIRLMIGGRYARFYLVKDANVAPRRGRAIAIPIDETFKLPAGQPNYQFPLFQGDGGSALRHEAFLRSPAFPLDQDLEVKLQLTYTYGSDAPYDLVFRPVEKTSKLDFVRAEWRHRNDEDDLPAHYPTLPPKMNWSQLRRYPKPGSTDTSDLLEWICDGLARVERHAAAVSSPRRTGIVTSSVRMDRNESRFVFAQTNGRSVFCHESEFVDAQTMDNLGRGDALTLNIEEGVKGLSGRAIAVGSDPTTTARALEHLARGLGSDIKRILRFPFLAAWSDGRSLLDFEAPDDFRKFMRHRMMMLLELSKSKDVFAYEALFLLSCMHADAPPEIFEPLNSVLNGTIDWLRQYRRHIAMALGACRLAWQRQLLANVVSIIRNETASAEAHSLCLGILGNAVWRCGDALDALSNEDVAAIVERLIVVLEQTNSAIGKENPESFIVNLKEQLELVLGLLRTRASDDPERKGLLAPRKPATKALAVAIEEILDSVAKYEIEIHSRLALDVDKPPALSKTPNILYALKLYLTGDDGARAIHVVAVREDDA